MKRVIFEIWKLSTILRTSIMGFLVIAIIAIIHSFVSVVNWGLFITTQVNFASLVSMLNLYIYQSGLKKQSKRDTVDIKHRNNTNTKLEELTAELRLQRDKLDVYEDRLRLTETKAQQALDFVSKEIIGKEAREMKTDKKELERLKLELQQLIDKQDENN